MQSGILVSVTLLNVKAAVLLYLYLVLSHQCLQCS